jgi:hypothetical protein
MWVSGQRHAPAALCPREFIPDIHWIGGWAGLRAGLDTETSGNIFTSVGDRMPVDQSVVRHYIDWATPAPINTEMKIIK